MHKQIQENKDEIFIPHLCCQVYNVINVNPCYNCGRVGHSALKCLNPIVSLKCASTKANTKLHTVKVRTINGYTALTAMRLTVKNTIQSMEPLTPINEKF